MSVTITKPQRRKRKLRAALDGVAGSGKSVSALAILRGVVGPEGRICAIDTEHESLLEYVGVFPGVNQPEGFDHIVLTDFATERYEEAIAEVVKQGYDGLLIDSATHAWAGKGGILEQVDRNAGDNAYFNKKGWREATPKHIHFIDTIIGAPLHVIVTLRDKSEYVIEKDETGKNAPKKIGMQPIQREGFDYEFSILGTMDLAHVLTITKARTLDQIDGKLSNFLEGARIEKPGIELGAKIREWLNAAPGEWEAPAFSRTFDVNGRTYQSKGVTRETFIKAAAAGTALDKAKGAGTSRALLTKAGVVSMADFTEPEGQAFIVALNEAK